MRAKTKGFVMDLIVADYDVEPREILVKGFMGIDGSKNVRRIVARLDVEQAQYLEFQLHASIIAARDGAPANDDQASMDEEIARVADLPEGHLCTMCGEVAVPEVGDICPQCVATWAGGTGAR